MIAVDTNILVYAHRADSSWHQPARDCVASLAEGSRSWVIPWPWVHEFLAIVTNSRIFKTPTPVDLAFGQLEAWGESSSLRWEGEGQDHLSLLRGVVVQGRARGAAIHDARIVAICLGCGVEELWSADRDFSRLSSIRIVNPLIAS